MLYGFKKQDHMDRNRVRGPTYTSKAGRRVFKKVRRSCNKRSRQSSRLVISSNSYDSTLILSNRDAVNRNINTRTSPKDHWTSVSFDRWWDARDKVKKEYLSKGVSELNPNEAPDESSVAEIYKIVKKALKRGFHDELYCIYYPYEKHMDDEISTVKFNSPESYKDIRIHLLDKHMGRFSLNQTLTYFGKVGDGVNWDRKAFDRSGLITHSFPYDKERLSF